MFSDDRFMTLATGLVLAIAVGAIAQNSGVLMDFFGDNPEATQDDQYTVMAGRNQVLDVLSNDVAGGRIKVVDTPNCGLVRNASGNTLEFYGSAQCEGKVKFSYCVESEAGCAANAVTLNVVRATKPESEAERVAKEAAAEEAAQVARNPVTRSRGSAGQILRRDDEDAEITISGFGGAMAPTLFAPDTTELITPNETVETLKRSVAAVAPSTVQRDQNIARQESGRTRMNLAIATDGLRSEIGADENGAGVALGMAGDRPSLPGEYSAPSRPGLGAAPSAPQIAAAPGIGNAGVGTPEVAFKVEERGPSVTAVPPRTMSFANVAEPRILVPAPIRHGAHLLTAKTMSAASPAGAPASADVSPATTGAVQVASSQAAGATDFAANNVAVASVTVGYRYVGGASALVGTANTEVLYAPDVTAGAPSAIAAVTGTEVFDADTSDATDGTLEMAAAEPLVEQASDGIVNIGDTDSAKVGDVVVASGQLIDESDVVVEMAAQILLPSARIGGVALNKPVSSADIAGLLTDEMFEPDLSVSEPPLPEETTEVASLATGVDRPIQVAPRLETSAVAANCPVSLSASARPGGEIALFVSSACRPNQAVTIGHAGLEFTERTSAGGSLSVTLPALTEFATVSTVFADGASEETSVTVRDAERVGRIAIVWSAPVELDLHAFEGSGGSVANHVWEGAPRSYRETLTRGGGYMLTYGDPSIIGGSRVEVYSLPATRVRENVTVEMNLGVGDASAICNDAIALRTVRTQTGTEAEVRRFNLKMPGCDTAAAGMVLENFTDALEITRR